MTSHVVFPSRAAAEAALYDLNSRAMDLWEADGYTVDRDLRVVYGKRGDSVDYTAVTTTWDEVTDHPDGVRAYFANPRTQYPAYADLLLSGHEYVEENVILQNEEA